jgi:hypothetical protein
MSEVGQLGVISSPAAMQARLEQLRSTARALGGDVASYAPSEANAAKWSQWAVQYATWLAAFEAYAPDWADRLWGATANQIENYAAQLERWRTALAKWPGANVTTPTAGVDKSPLEHLGEAMRGAAVLIGGALLGVGALVLLKGRK